MGCKDPVHNRALWKLEKCFAFFFFFKLTIFNILLFYCILLYFLTLFLAALGLCCCMWAFSSCSKVGDYSSLRCTGFSLHWLLLLQSTGSRCIGFSSCGTQALERRLSSCGTWVNLLRGMWDLPWPGIEPVSSASAGGFLITVPAGKSLFCLFQVSASACLTGWVLSGSGPPAVLLDGMISRSGCLCVHVTLLHSRSPAHTLREH